MRVKEVPIQFVDRTAGKSKMSRKIFLEAVAMVWKLRFDALRRQALTWGAVPRQFARPAVTRGTRSYSLTADMTTCG